MRTAAARTALPLIAAAVLGAAAPPRPDLAVRRDGFARNGDSLRVVVENLGAAPSPATEIELSDRPFLGGISGTSSQYRPVPGIRAVWVDQEPEDSTTVRLTLHLGRDREAYVSRGSLEFRDPTEFSPVRAVDGVRATGERRVDWEIDLPPEGAEIALRVVPGRGAPPEARILLMAEADRLAPPIYTSAERRRGNATFLVDCLDRPRAARARAPVRALLPGERDTTTVLFAGGATGEAIARVDPDGAVDEAREGNNASTWTGTHGRWTLAALHVHTCFSEGPGSFDWQAQHAALSGYDLVWWSEHDWRVSCRDHLERIGFEEPEPIEVTFETEGALSEADFAPGEAPGSRAVRLATGEGGGRARAVVEAERKRFAYALASELDVSVRVLARALRPGDVLRIGFDLSYHPAGARTLVHELRWEGSPAPDAEGGGANATPWEAKVPGTVPTGGWVTVRIPLSREAADAWPNGLDDNLIGLWFELEAASAAEVLWDDVEIAHRLCGAELLRVEQEWSERYPNLRQEIGGEISHGSPHLGRYGGSAELLWLDMERVGSGSGVERTEEAVRVVHAASAVASWCHPLGVTVFSRGIEVQLDEAMKSGLAGVDALEIGYRERAGKTFGDYLDLWNRVSAEGVLVTALGVNDSHHNQWAPWENDFATWLDAPADDPDALLRALRTGRAFFGDPVRFRGRVELQAGGARMGDVVRGEGPRAVRILLTDPGPDRTVRLIADGAVLREWTGVGGSGVLGEQLAPGQARVVRAEVWTADGEPLAFTNPIFFDPAGSLRRSGE